MSKRSVTAKKKKPHFKHEAQEAAWWENNQDLVADHFAQAKAEGKLGQGTVARLAQERANRSGPSPTITIRLPKDELDRARALAAKRGLRYHTYLKMLLHQSLESEERRTSRD